MRNRTIQAFCFTVLVLSSGCLQSPGSDACGGADTDCKNGYACVNLQCVPDPNWRKPITCGPQNPCAAGASCMSDGLCYKSSIVKCARDTECSNGNTCNLSSGVCEVAMVAPDCANPLVVAAPLWQRSLFTAGPKGANLMLYEMTLTNTVGCPATKLTNLSLETGENQFSHGILTFSPNLHVLIDDQDLTELTIVGGPGGSGGWFFMPMGFPQNVSVTIATSVNLKIVCLNCDQVPAGACLTIDGPGIYDYIPSGATKSESASFQPYKSFVIAQ